MSSDPSDDVACHIRDFYLSLTFDWRTLSSKSMTRAERLGSYLLCRAGLVECAFEGLAWTESSSVDFSATVCGEWIDAKRNSILPASIRNGVPAWKDRPVSAQPREELRVRLTAFGEQNQPSVRANLDTHWIPAPYAATFQSDMFIAWLGLHPIRGRATVRILASHKTAPGCGSEPKQDTVLDVVLELRDVQNSMAQKLDELHQNAAKGVGLMRMEEIRLAYPQLTEAQFDALGKRLKSWREQHEDEVMMTEPDPKTDRRRYAYPAEIVSTMVHAITAKPKQNE